MLLVHGNIGIGGSKRGIRREYCALLTKKKGNIRKTGEKEKETGKERGRESRTV